jgi:phosphatidylserine decarboxylase
MKISIFMSVFDVHVNRVPCTGVVQGIDYRKGRFLDVRKDRASAENEQNWLWIRTDSGVDVVLTQVAGLIARRIVCWPSVGDRVNRGERFGLIRFGSRLEVYVPEGSTLLVSRGDHVYGGETVLCRLN